MVNGKVEATSEVAAVQYLKTNGLFPIQLNKLEAGTTSKLGHYINRVTFNDIVNFTRQLAIMLNAGLTLIDAFDILIKQIEKKTLLEVVIEIDKELKGGNSFSDSIAKYPHLFSNLYIALIRSGEASGKLNEVLIKLAEDLEKSEAFKNKIKGALVYPAIVVIGMVVVAFIMMTFVLPSLLTLFKDLNAELPLQTQILIVVSNFFAKFWAVVIVLTAAGIFLLSRYLKTPLGKEMLDGLLLQIPIINSIIRKSTLVNTTRTLSILIGSGVSILEGLRIIIDTTTNSLYKKAFMNIATQVERGTSLGQAMINEEVFPPILVQMTLVGEQTGHLDETLLRVSNYFQIESENSVKALTTLIEPFILVVLGVGVAFLVTAIITPIYSIGNAIK